MPCEVAGLRLDRALVEHHRFGDHRGDVVAMLGKHASSASRSFQGTTMVASRASGSWPALAGLCRAGLELDQHVVEPAMVLALEAEDAALAGDSAGEAEGGLHGLGAGHREAHHVGPAERLADRPRRPRPRAGAGRRRPCRWRSPAATADHHRGVGVAEEGRALAEQVVDVVAAVDVVDARAHRRGRRRCWGHRAGRWS